MCKVKMTKESKQVVTIDLAPIAAEMVRSLNSDGGIPNEELAKAIYIASDGKIGFEILSATAEISMNGRIWNTYSDESEKLDIWIRIKAFNDFYGFYAIGCYLSDLWQYDGTEESAESIRNQMYIRHFTED